MSTIGWQGRCFRPHEIAWVKEWAAKLVAAVESLEVNHPHEHCAFFALCTRIIYMNIATTVARIVDIYHLALRCRFFNAFLGRAKRQTHRTAAHEVPIWCQLQTPRRQTVATS